MRPSLYEAALCIALSVRIFTVDSLTDADLRKDMRFGGINDEYSQI